MFTLAGTTKQSRSTFIDVRKNGFDEFRIGYASNNRAETYEYLSGSWIMKLNSQDIVTLYTEASGFSTNGNFPLIFTGHLIKTDQ